MRLSLIAALAKNGVIGNANTMPWHLPEDLKRFKALTLGHPVIMGRRTHESIGRPLPGRHNLVISGNPGYEAPGCTVCPSLEAALAACAASDENIFVIGGAQVYAQALPRADRLCLTEIHQDYAGDTRFPDFPRENWLEVSREAHHPASGPAFDFVVYQRRPLSRSGD